MESGANRSVLWRWLAACAAYVCCYVVLVRLSSALADPVTQVSPVWPAAGLPLALLLRFGWRKAWAPMVAGVLLGVIVASFLVHDPDWYGSIVGNIGGPLLGAFLVERYAGGRRFPARPQQVILFVLLGPGLGGALAAVCGTLAIFLSGTVPAAACFPVWRSWCVSDVMGALLLVPPLLAWSEKSAPNTQSRGKSPLEGILLALIALVVTQFAFDGWPFMTSALSLEYLCIPIVLWAAFRFPQRGAATLILGVAVLAVTNTQLGCGAFARHSESLTLLQIYLGSISLLGLLTASSVRERAQQAGVLRLQTERLQSALLEAEAARREAERANRAKSEFLSRMSHELRTPMNAILGFTQILEMEDPTPPQLEAIGHILKGGHHLLGLINEMLDLARLEAGNMRLEPRLTNARQLLAESLDLIRPLATRRGLVLETRFGEDAANWVSADPQRLKQILVNFLSNAVKFNRDGGVITASCEAVSADRLRLSVRDTGPGIAPDAQAVVFTAFERLSADRAGIEGTGLGLAVAKRLADLMGATLGLESVPGEGSVFFLELPRLDAPPPEPADGGNELVTAAAARKLATQAVLTGSPPG